MPSIHTSPVRNLLIAALAVVVATLLRAALDPLGLELAPFAVFYPAVLVAALIGGLWPGAAALAASGAVAVLLWVEPRGLVTSSGLANFILFVVSGSAVLVAAEALRRSAARRLHEQAHFQALAKQVPAILWTVGPDGVAETLNGDRWREYTGLDPDRLTEGGWDAVLHPDDIAASREAWSEAHRSDGWRRSSVTAPRTAAIGRTWSGPNPFGMETDVSCNGSAPA